MNRLRFRLTLCLLGTLTALPTAAPGTTPDPQVGRSFQVPYLLTQTNHYVVRALINGKGPFHLVVDTGAPGLFLATEAAKKAGIASDPKKFYSVMDELKLEGGPTLAKMPIRVEDPFQLVGMNALGLPGMKLDGLMGFSVLARYRITLDPTHRQMVWTRLDFEPRDAIVNRREIRKEDIPVQLQAMEMLGPAMKFAAFFIGKQPPTQRLPQGFAGFSVKETNEGETKSVTIGAIVPDSPAAEAGLQCGDEVIACDGKPVRDAAELAETLSKKAAGANVSIETNRAGVKKKVELELQEWF